MTTYTREFSGYTVPVSADPSYYGSECTQADAERIVSALSEMIRVEFPGVAVERYSGIGSAAVKGADQDTCDQITSWISENWTKAL